MQIFNMKYISFELICSPIFDEYIYLIIKHISLIIYKKDRKTCKTNPKSRDIIKDLKHFYKFSMYFI